MKRVLIGILVVVVLGVGVGPFLVPVPPLDGTVPPAQLAGPDSRFMTVDGLQVHYTLAGTPASTAPATPGTPPAAAATPDALPAPDAPSAAAGANTFLLLHGFGASTFTWRNVQQPFARRGFTVAYDRTAFGLTERPLEPEEGWDDGNPEGTHPYGTGAQVRQAIGVLDALHVQRAVLVGNSAGGRTAVDVALAHPERVRALILISPAVGIGGGPPGWLAPLLRTPQLEHLGPLLVRRISGSGGSSLLNAAWHDPTKITPDVLEGYRKPLRANDWDKALWSLSTAPRTDDPLPRLGALAGIPTLVITGDDDRVVPVPTSKAVAAAIPGSTLVVIPACGHVPQEECPDDVMRAVDAFLAGPALR